MISFGSNIHEVTSDDTRPLINAIRLCCVTTDRRKSPDWQSSSLHIIGSAVDPLILVANFVWRRVNGQEERRLPSNTSRY